MYYQANSNPHKTEVFIDIFEIPKHGEEGFSFEDDPWTETFIDTLTTDSPKQIIALLVPSAPLAKFRTGNFIARNDRLGFSTKERSLIALEFIGLNTEQFKILSKIELVRSEPIFKDYFRLKPQTNLILKKVSLVDNLIELNNIQYQFDCIATRPNHPDGVVAGAVRRSEDQTLLLLPLPKAEPNKIIPAVTKIAKFYSTKTQKYWDGAKGISEERKKPSECQKYVLRIPKKGIPTLNGKELYYLSRTEPNHRKNLRQGAHIKLLKLLRDAEEQTIQTLVVLDELNCEPKQLNDIVSDLRGSFEIATSKRTVRDCLYRIKGKQGIIKLNFQIEQ